MCGSVPSSMGIWSVLHINALYLSKLTEVFRTDSSVQEPDRLDTPVNRVRSSDTRTHIGYCTGVWRFSIFQYCKLTADPRTMDANVCNSESELDTNGI
jgi:hypothetical protein